MLAAGAGGGMGQGWAARLGTAWRGSTRTALFSSTYGIPRAWGIKPHSGTRPVAAEGRATSSPASVSGGWHGVAGGMPAPIGISSRSPPAGIFSGRVTGQAGGAAGRADQQEHHPFPGGVQGLPGTAAVQEEEGSSQRLSPPRSSAAQFRLKWAVQPFCRRLGQRLLLLPPPRACPAVGSRGGPGRTGGPGGNRQGGCWASPWRDEATYCLLLLLLKRV